MLEARVDGIDGVFDNHLVWIESGSGFIPVNNELPMYSTCFWQTDRDLTMFRSYEKTRYRYYYREGNRCISYVGFQEAIEVIPANTLIRLSLTRKFNFNGNNGFWLQLSGWYD